MVDIGVRAPSGQRRHKTGVAAVDTTGMENTGGTGNTRSVQAAGTATAKPPASTYGWVADVALAGAVTGALTMLAIPLLWELDDKDVDGAGVVLALVVVMTYTAAALHSLRFRGVPLLTVTAGVMTWWQWFAYTPTPTFHEVWETSSPNYLSALTSGAVVGLAVTATAAVNKVGLGRPPRHPREHQPRRQVLLWAAAALLIPAAITWFTVIRPAIVPPSDVGECIEAPTDSGISNLCG